MSAEKRKVTRITSKSLVLFWAFLLSFSLAKAMATDLPYASKQMEQLLTKIEKQKRQQVKQVLRRLNDIYDKHIMDENSDGSASGLSQSPDHFLRVFVSRSMGREALIHYGKEAKKYGASLVLRGLPDGSFRTLSSIVHDISKEVPNLSLQIDDLAFVRFGVGRVPSIVLSREKDCFMQDDCIPAFDKVDGAISISGALQIMQEKGDIQDIAKALIEGDFKETNNNG